MRPCSAFWVLFRTTGKYTFHCFFSTMLFFGFLGVFLVAFVGDLK